MLEGPSGLSTDDFRRAIRYRYLPPAALCFGTSTLSKPRSRAALGDITMAGTMARSVLIRTLGRLIAHLRRRLRLRRLRRDDPFLYK